MLIQAQKIGERGKNLLARPNYHLTRSWCHPTKKLGQLSGDFTHAASQDFWLRCQAVSTDAAGTTSGRLTWQN